MGEAGTSTATAVGTTLEGTRRPGARPRSLRKRRVDRSLWAARALVVFACVLVAIPPLLIVLTSFKPLAEIYKAGKFGLDPVPSHWTLGNYQLVFAQYGSQLARWLLNSLIYAGAYCLFGVFTALCGAYALVRYQFRARRAVLMAVILTLMVPLQVTFVPLFQLFTTLHQVNSYGGLVLPGIASAFAFYLLYQFLLAVPHELYDAAIVDGAGAWRVLARIVVPLAKNGVSAVAIILFVGAWNDYFWPLVITSKSSMYPLVVGLATVQGTGAAWTNPGEVIAFGTLLMLPVTIVYGFVQRHIVRGIATSGLNY
jgi:multiple sugar transport system permease protein